MFKFAWKNMVVHRARAFLVALSIVVSASVGLLASNISSQVSEGIISTAAYYDLIIGPSGSATQLAMNSMFFTDEPLGTIPYEYVEEIEKSGLANSVVPFTMGDSYNGARIVGTTPSFLEGRALKEGEMFSKTFTAVVGYSVAERYGLSVGDEMITSHGLAGTGTEHASSPLTVTGILQKTGTAYDNVVFTACDTVWAVHDHGDHDEETEDDHAEGEEHDHAEGEEHDHAGEGEHDHAEHGEICAILVKSKSFNDYYKLLDYYGKNAALLCINPSTVLREVLEQVDLSTRIIYVLCGVILVMNIVVISVITLLNMYDAQKEIALMRLIGVSMKKIGLLYLIQNGLIGLISTVASLLMAHLCLGLMGGLVASMGIVLNGWRIYPQEFAILAGVFVISVLPTMLRILSMSRRDGLSA